MAEVLLENIKKIYTGGIVAVREFNLAVADEEFLVLVGPSGCGKSTTLRMIAGLEQITEGTISIDAKVVNDVVPKNRDIAMVFQNYALYPHMSVFENMAFGLKLRKTPRDEIRQRVRSAAAILGIEELLDRRPRALSGGQRQRVAVGRAIVRRPKVFLFDEPLSNLDAKLRVEMRKELNQLHHRLGATIVYVTHDQIEAMTLGERIVVMKDGIIQQVGPPLEVYNWPLNKFVAGFIGTPPMNFLAGRLEETDGEIAFTADRWRIPVIKEEFRERLHSYLGRNVFLGVRPEDMLDRAHNPDARGQGNLSATVEMVEPLGDESLVYLSFENQDQGAVMKVPSDDRVAKGAMLDIALTPEKIHIFEAETEWSLTADPEIVATQPVGSAPRSSREEAAAAVSAAAAKAASGA